MNGNPAGYPGNEFSLRLTEDILRFVAKSKRGQ
jgi:hypothetical protein